MPTNILMPRENYMAIKNLNTFLHTYFSAHQCQVTDNNDGILHVQLTEEMDKLLMNRPFYWHYIKQTGSQGEPMDLTLITDTDKSDEKGEMIHFGSPRLQQIMNELKTSERFARLFEYVDTSEQTPLYPWLIINMKISYQGKQKKDELFSIGLHLMNGKMQLKMMETLKEYTLHMSISDYCYTLSPIIKPESGLKRIETVIEDYINKQSHDWAKASKQALHEEIQLLEHFYEDQQDTDSNYKEKEINELIERYEPKINMQIVNGGIFYLQD